MEVINKSASFNYFIEEEIECGIVLTGTEMKAIRDYKVNLKDSYAVIKKGEVFLINSHIAEYKEGNIFNHDPRRTRKLLLHKKEIQKLNTKLNQEGYTLIPLKLYFKKNKVKILLGLCKGKKLYDKRETIKERDLKRETLKLEKYNYK